jgi:hypothetical protein
MFPHPTSLRSVTLPTASGGRDNKRNPRASSALSRRHSPLEEQQMPILLWLLGVPLGLVIVLMILGVA